MYVPGSSAEEDSSSGMLYPSVNAPPAYYQQRWPYDEPEEEEEEEEEHRELRQGMTAAQIRRTAPPGEEVGPNPVIILSVAFGTIVVGSVCAFFVISSAMGRSWTGENGPAAPHVMRRNVELETETMDNTWTSSREGSTPQGFETEAPMLDTRNVTLARPWSGREKDGVTNATSVVQKS